MLQRPYQYAAPLASVVFLAALCIAGYNALPAWDPTICDMSDLGNTSGMVGKTFNTGCIIAGIMMLYFGIGKALFEKRLHRYSGICFIFAGAGLIAIAIATKSVQPAHDMAAGSLLFFAGAGMFLATYSDIVEGHYLVKRSTLILIVILLIQWPLFAGAISETMPIVIIAAWSFIQLHVHKQA